jgi:2-C-methyl-D-erythritol 4-phosphate cytidylyltransferase/2-C-methyl-D-erythritol 2,4-cyclodiphosphate synthase
MSVAAVIVAGGSGVRAGGPLPKQYQLMGGKPVIRWTMEAILSHPQVDHVQAVIGAGHEQLYAEAMAGLQAPPPVIGGKTRQESSHAGLKSCAGAGHSKVLIHDAARPFLSHALITAVIDRLDQAEAVVPGLAVADTMKYAPSGIIERTVDRSALWLVQTPQGFHFDSILNAHRLAARDKHDQFTDDAAVAEFAKLQVHIIPGEQKNRKLTTQHDIDVASRELGRQELESLPEVRMGQGIDFHVFETGDQVTLCGVNIPHDRKLKGHSDADAALHALTDAILGAIGERDIGHHFPPTDARWKGAPSSVFVTKAIELVRARGGRLANVDITILAEAPRINPHIDTMKQSLQAMLGLAADRIAIKATTTEGMGAIGRGEGIGAQAVATVRLPL